MARNTGLATYTNWPSWAKSWQTSVRVVPVIQTRIDLIRAMPSRLPVARLPSA